MVSSASGHAAVSIREVWLGIRPQTFRTQSSSAALDTCVGSFPPAQNSVFHRALNHLPFPINLCTLTMPKVKEDINEDTRKLLERHLGLIRPVWGDDFADHIPANVRPTPSDRSSYPNDPMGWSTKLLDHLGRTARDTNVSLNDFTWLLGHVMRHSPAKGIRKQKVSEMGWTDVSMVAMLLKEHTVAHLRQTLATDGDDATAVLDWVVQKMKDSKEEYKEKRKNWGKKDSQDQVMALKLSTSDF